MEEHTFVDRHGVEVFTRRWPVTDPAGLVVLSHGASEHSGRYDRFALALNAAGFAAVALDHRGHGRTDPTSPPGVMGAGGGRAVVDDLHELRTSTSAAVGDDVPVFVFAALPGLADRARPTSPSIPKGSRAPCSAGCPPTSTASPRSAS